jgi:hypothetical protein
METAPVTELSETELDEVFGGQQGTVCPATADIPCTICNS